MDEKRLFDGAWVKGQMDRFARELLSRDQGNLALAGIRTGGAVMAQRLAALVKAMGGREVPVGLLDITLYRDDIDRVIRSSGEGTQIAFDLTDKRLVLIDDVLFTGRTIRAAMDELIDFGRPRMIELWVLVDRGWRELPIEAALAGARIETARDDSVVVRLAETDGVDEVLLKTAR